jgi:hypothetical protein
MSSTRERRRLLMQNNRTNAQYVQHENSCRRLRSQQRRRLQYELTGMKIVTYDRLRYSYCYSYSTIVDSFISFTYFF